MSWNLFVDISQSFTSIAAVLLSLIAIWKTKRDNNCAILFEKKLELYGELAYLLEKIYNDHDLIVEYYERLRGLYAKGYYIASENVSELLQGFVEAMDEELIDIKEYKKLAIDDQLITIN
ncbi:hypothetical protein [Streptococcus henryi]|uniref:hypothetical protein n=1 Tax=Streptococcus henryi TaxID=439219 RepID=UPI00036DDE8C|nr:hypothetical protein [Streptococcus henryi]